MADKCTVNVQTSIWWHGDLLLGNECEISDYTTAIAR
jgi:hypothetical protein